MTAAALLVALLVADPQLLPEDHARFQEALSKPALASHGALDHDATVYLICVGLVIGYVLARIETHWETR